jgi:hypothetical protein
VLSSNKGHEKQQFLMLDDAIERTFLEMLNAIDSVAVAEAVADLNLYSDALVDWLSGAYGSHLITTGHWPLRHVSFICDRVAAFLADSQLQHGDKNDPATLAAHATNLQRASRLVSVIFGRLYSPSFKPGEEVQVREALGKVVPIFGDGCNAQTILESLLVRGSAEQGPTVIAQTILGSLLVKGSAEQSSTVQVVRVVRMLAASTWLSRTSLLTCSG